MSKPVFGKVLTERPINVRDATHIPIIVVVAGDIISPAEDIRLEKPGDEDGLFVAFPSTVGNRVGVADPFLSVDVHPGQMFYCWLKPESTKKLWHQWTHRLIDK